MRISTKGRYGLRVLLDVAMHQQNGPVILRDISKRQGISEKYLWQVINPLKGAGLVNAVRGAHGGYTLARLPERITVLEIVSVLEGSVDMVDCLEDPDGCDRSGACVARGVWNEIQNRLREAMAGITLKELIQKQRDFDTSASPSYVI